MSLTTNIDTIISELYPDATFILSSKFNANLASFSLESTELPLIILDNELSKEAEIKLNDNVQKNSRIMIYFLALDNIENTDAQSDVIRSDMESMADSVAVKIYQLLEVRPIGKQRYKLIPMFHVFNTNLTGVTLDMQVNYNEIINF